MVGTNQRNYLVSQSGRTSCRSFFLVRFWSRQSLVSAREKVIPTNETTWSVRTNEWPKVSSFVIGSFVTGLVCRWSRRGRKSYQPTKLSGQSGRTSNRRYHRSLLFSFVVGLREEESRTNQRNSGQSGRHSLVRFWSRSSLVSAREKG